MYYFFYQFRQSRFYQTKSTIFPFLSSRLSTSSISPPKSLQSIPQPVLLIVHASRKSANIYAAAAPSPPAAIANPPVRSSPSPPPPLQFNTRGTFCGLSRCASSPLPSPCSACPLSRRCGYIRRHHHHSHQLQQDKHRITLSPSPHLLSTFLDSHPYRQCGTPDPPHSSPPIVHPCVLNFSVS